MIEFRIRVADRVAAISAMFESTRNYCRNYLTQEEPDFSVAIRPEDIAREREKSIREALCEGIPAQPFTDAYLETLAVQRQITQQLFAHNTLLFHGSVVAVDGVGYLFTAPSGTGKSTHTRLWRQVFGDRAVMINDDKPFLRITGNGVLVYGSPWNGKHGLGTNTCVPLKAICLLERGTENHIRKVPVQEVIPMLFQQSSRPMDPRLMPQYMALIDSLAQSISFYRLSCNMEPEAAWCAYTAMSAGEQAE